MLFVVSPLLAQLGFLALRLALGAVFFVHGIPKLKSASVMAQGMGKPSWLIMLLGLVEILSATLVTLGAWEQLGALGITIVMLGAIFHKMFKWHMPFMAPQSTGWEFDLILLASALLILFNGDGGLTLCGLIKSCPLF